MNNINQIKVYAVKFRYPKTAPFKLLLFDNMLAAIDFKEYWQDISNKRCVGAIKEILVTKIPNDIQIYHTVNDATQCMFRQVFERYTNEDAFNNVVSLKTRRTNNGLEM